MIKNYLTIAWRNLIKNKVSAIINIGGLSVGMGVAILIGLWIWSELSYDAGFKNRERIAQVMENVVVNGEVETYSGASLMLAPALRATHGSVFRHVVMATYAYDHPVLYGTKSVMLSGSFIEPGITDMLSLTMVRGSADGLSDPSSVLIAESAAKAIFGPADPLGKVISIDKMMNGKVAGVYADLPAASTFGNLRFIAPWQMIYDAQHYGSSKVFPNPWGASQFQTFVQLADNVDMDQVSASIKNVKLDALKQVDTADVRFKSALFLHPMSRWYLYGDFKDGVSAGGRIQYVWLFGLIGVFVLLLACINFMNLSTARSERRAREVGIRKAIGSVRSSLIAQFYCESLLIAVLAFFISLLLVQLSLPAFNVLAGKQIVLLWGNPVFWVLSVGFCLFTGLVAGSYPALYLSSFRPVRVLKGTFRVGRWAAIPRKVLVVLQFTVSTVLIIGTIVVFQQIQYAKNRPVGFDRNNLVNITLQTDDIVKQYSSFRNDLLASGYVSNVASSQSMLTNAYFTNSGFNWRGKDPSLVEQFVTMAVTSDFGKTVGWQVVAGRDFNGAFLTDSMCLVVNEAAVRIMGFKQPIGEIVDAGGMKFTIIGVVRDMVNQSAYASAMPDLFYLPRFGPIYNVIIRIDPRVSAHDAVGVIGRVFKKYDPATPFSYQFIDEDYAGKFANEEHIGELASCFAGLAIFISCLGLFGMASFMAEQRTREIGVRKVLGASVFNLWRLLSRDFVLLVVVSLVIATPVAYYFMHNWLQRYDYRTEIGWWVFAATALAAMVITLATVSFQSIRAALANPVVSLRSE